MPSLALINIALFAISVLGLLAVFVLYPLLLFVLSIRSSSRPAVSALPEPLPTVSFLIVVRNAQDLIEEKIRNCLAMDYPRQSLQVVVFSDGSTDETQERARGIADPRVMVCGSVSHGGKIRGMNAGIEHCTGEIVVFSDADAICAADTLKVLLQPFSDKEVGGVCGQRVISSDPSQIKKAQGIYIRLDSAIKRLESERGRLTSNDGKLYAIRRSLYRPVTAGVTDDLFVCLSIISQGARFVFQPQARAVIRVPSRNPRHEIQRRRRIVVGSLYGIWIMRELLNPFRYGLFSLGLFVNKVMRRMMPFFLIALFCTSSLAASSHSFFAAVFLAQLFCYLVALLCAFNLWLQRGAAQKFGTLAFYFCIGNWGVLLGVFDFLSGRKVEKWTPMKSDRTEGADR